MPRKSTGDARPYTNELLELIEDGVVDKDYVIAACLKFMSDDEVYEMMRLNDLLEDDYDEDED